jgi:hypothetical protein
MTMHDDVRGRSRSIRAVPLQPVLLPVVRPRSLGAMRFLQGEADRDPRRPRWWPSLRLASTPR